MNSEQKNLSYWFSLPLWPLDSACRLLCGADVNNPDQAPLSMRDPATRPAWVNLFHMATADDEIEIIEGKGGARGVDPAAFIKWARSKGYRLDAKFDVLLASLTSGDDIPGKMPQTNIGKLAIKAAWQIECSTGKQATAKQVIEKLQAWTETEPELTETIPHGVKWATTKGKQKPFDVEACAKTLGTWQASRA